MPEPGTIEIIRESAFVGGLRSYKIYVDDRRVGKIANGKTILVPATAGGHDVFLTIGLYKSDTIPVSVPPSGTAHLRCRDGKSLKRLSVKGIALWPVP
jgi:hypothetical protein